jgi:hypothetical protein
MFRAAYRSSSGALSVFAGSGLHTHLVTGLSSLRIDYGRSPHAYVNQRLQINLELLMMSGMLLETCWASMKGGIINSNTRLHLVGYFYWVILRCMDPWILNRKTTHCHTKQVRIKWVIWRLAEWLRLLCMACQFNYGGNTAEDATLYFLYFVASITTFMVKASWLIGVTNIFGLSPYKW